MNGAPHPHTQTITPTLIFADHSLVLIVNPHLFDQVLWKEPHSSYTFDSFLKKSYLVGLD